MINTSSISSLLRDNKSYRIHNEILTGSKYGMVALEVALVDLYQRGLIAREFSDRTRPGSGCRATIAWRTDSAVNAFFPSPSP